MKFNYIIASMAVAFMATACDSKLEVFEPAGGTYSGNPETVANVTAEALPGQIKLSWDDNEAKYEYLKIWYTDPRTKQVVTKLVSPSLLGKSEIVLDETRARYGDYTIHFQAFNDANKGGKVVDIVAQSGPAPTTIVEDTSKRSRHRLRDDQFSTDNQEPNEGPIKNLNDDNTNTFFHTRWSGTQVPLPQYVQVDFEQSMNAFQLWYCTRNTGNADGFPTAATIQVQPVGTTDWVDIAYLSDLPTTSVTWYESTFFYYEEPFDKFRFLVTGATRNSNYFHMSSLDIYDVSLTVFNPETDEEEVE